MHTPIIFLTAFRRDETETASAYANGAVDFIVTPVLAEVLGAKWDGSGYPCGLAGEEIPIAGRIVAVADVFDALTHVRPYKPKCSVASAMEEITGHAGRHFDPGRGGFRGRIRPEDRSLAWAG
jgi:response regulator RpfG family c-di-GMP phosphodiesterase